MTSKPARILIVAGSDSGGGAGIQADIKTVTALGAYAMTAITALTAQDTREVAAVHPVPPDFIAQQMRLCLADIGADAVKTGMVGGAESIEAICAVLDEAAYRDIPVVVDPVMVAQSGATLLEPDAMAALKRRLLFRADVITPNIPEAEKLTGIAIRQAEDMRHAAEMLLTTGVRAVLVKGGHGRGDQVIDILATEDYQEVFESPRIETRSTHGTGCTLASAIATRLGQGQPLAAAVADARAYLQEALLQAPGLGHGHGPLWHGHTVGTGR